MTQEAREERAYRVVDDVGQSPCPADGEEGDTEEREVDQEDSGAVGQPHASRAEPRGVRIHLPSCSSEHHLDQRREERESLSSFDHSSRRPLGSHGFR